MAVKMGRHYYEYICTGLVLMFFIGFFLFVRYNSPLIGDDVGELVNEYPYYTYMDDYVPPAQKTLNMGYSPAVMWKELSFYYMKWNGRVSQYLLIPITRMILTDMNEIRWVVFAIYITTILICMYLCILRMVFGNLKKAFAVPLKTLLIGLLLFYVPTFSYAYMSRMFMYTFANIYGLAVILYMLYCSGVRQRLERDDFSNVKRLVGLNLTGLLAGLSMEADGVVFGAVMLVQVIRYWMKKKKIDLRCIVMYVGFVIGFCLCAFAPGLLNRSRSTHEAAMHTVPLIERMLKSIWIHLYAASRVFIVPAIGIPLAVFVVLFLLHQKKITIKELLAASGRHAEWFIAYMISALFWGVCPEVVIYGMLATNVVLVIGVFKVINEIQEMINCKGGTGKSSISWIRSVCMALSVLIPICMIGVKLPELRVVSATAKVWRDEIFAARELAENGQEPEIVLPRYPEDTDYRFFMTNFNNDQSMWDGEPYRLVYGVHIVLE